MMEDVSIHTLKSRTGNRNARVEIQTGDFEKVGEASAYEDQESNEKVEALCQDLIEDYVRDCDKRNDARHRGLSTRLKNKGARNELLGKSLPYVPETKLQNKLLRLVHQGTLPTDDRLHNGLVRALNRLSPNTDNGEKIGDMLVGLGATLDTVTKLKKEYASEYGDDPEYSHFIGTHDMVDATDKIDLIEALLDEHGILDTKLIQVKNSRIRNQDELDDIHKTHYEYIKKQPKLMIELLSRRFSDPEKRDQSGQEAIKGGVEGINLLSRINTLIYSSGGDYSIFRQGFEQIMLNEASLEEKLQLLYIVNRYADKKLSKFVPVPPGYQEMTKARSHNHFDVMRKTLLSQDYNSTELTELHEEYYGPTKGKMAFDAEKVISVVVHGGQVSTRVLTSV